MSNPLSGWFQFTYIYNDETVMMIMNLYITYLTRCSGFQEIHTTTDLEFLVLRYKILHKI